MPPPETPQPDQILPSGSGWEQLGNGSGWIRRKPGSRQVEEFSAAPPPLNNALTVRPDLSPGASNPDSGLPDIFDNPPQPQDLVIPYQPLQYENQQNPNTDPILANTLWYLKFYPLWAQAIMEKIGFVPASVRETKDTMLIVTQVSMLTHFINQLDTPNSQPPGEQSQLNPNPMGFSLGSPAPEDPVQRLLKTKVNVAKTMINISEAKAEAKERLRISKKRNESAEGRLFTEHVIQQTKELFGAPFDWAAGQLGKIPKGIVGLFLDNNGGILPGVWNFATQAVRNTATTLGTGEVAGFAIVGTPMAIVGYFGVIEVAQHYGLALNIVQSWWPGIGAVGIGLGSGFAGAAGARAISGLPDVLGAGAVNLIRKILGPNTDTQLPPPTLPIPPNIFPPAADQTGANSKIELRL